MVGPVILGVLSAILAWFVLIRMIGTLNASLELAVAPPIQTLVLPLVPVRVLGRQSSSTLVVSLLMSYKSELSS